MIKWFVYGVMLAGPTDPGFVKVFNCHVADTQRECQIERNDLEQHYLNERRGLSKIVSPCLRIDTRVTDPKRLCEKLKRRLHEIK